MITSQDEDTKNKTSQNQHNQTSETQQLNRFLAMIYNTTQANQIIWKIKTACKSETNNQDEETEYFDQTATEI